MWIKNITATNKIQPGMHSCANMANTLNATHDQFAALIASTLPCLMDHVL